MQEESAFIAEQMVHLGAWLWKTALQASSPTPIFGRSGSDSLGYFPSLSGLGARVVRTHSNTEQIPL